MQSARLSSSKTRRGVQACIGDGLRRKAISTTVVQRTADREDGAAATWRALKVLWTSTADVAVLHLSCAICDPVVHSGLRGASGAAQRETAKEDHQDNERGKGAKRSP